MPSKKNARSIHKKTVTVKSEVPFFLSMIVVIILSLGMVIIAQKIALTYMSREFPRVAEYNYRVLRADMMALEERISLQISEVQNVCQFRPWATSTLPVSF